MKTNFLLIGFLSLALHGVAVAGGAVAGATEITQIANNVQLAASYAEQAQQTITQINQYRAMLQNLQQMTPSALLDQAAQQLFTDQKMYSTFKKLQTVVIDGQKVAYTAANLDQQFKNLHPGYGNGGTDFARQFKNLSDSTLGAVRNATALVTAHSENFASEQGMMQELASKSQSAQGQMQALQAGNQVGLAMVGQMQQMRQLQMAEMQQQGAFIAGQQTKEDTNDAALKQFFNRGTTRVRTIEEINRANTK